MFRSLSVVARSVAFKPSFSQLRFASKFAVELQQSLAEEHKYELENKETPDFLRDFKSRGIWTIQDTEGQREVSLKRKFENEHISVIFSTDAISDAVEEFESEEEPISPVTVSILIEKDNHDGALEITAVAQDETFFIENVTYLKSKSVAHDSSAEADWVRRGDFGGPSFSEMDEKLIETFHKYIEERGFDSELSNFVADYVVLKEQNEYERWLKNLSEFVAK
ncbi:Mitochondrial acidic protein mam33 [Terramyces sp. JEL0728]|nr:Mitochondrial acidic protein mam33 [Terramyces sp. JEL0728]